MEKITTPSFASRLQRGTIFFFLIFSILLSAGKSFGQSYGLGFYSHEVDQEKRTSLDLTPGGPICFRGNFDISFDLSFLADRQVYYGYIFRIIEDDRQNFDLIYDNEAEVFNFIIGEKAPKIRFSIPREQLYEHWHKMQISFDVEHSQLVIRTGNRSFVQQNVPLEKSGCFKILFGANNYKRFSTTDIPPMNIREIRIFQQQGLRYYWPLNEKSGTAAHEETAHKDAAVKQPLWNRASHCFWKMEKELLLNGPASVAFDARQERLLIAGNDSLFSYTVKDAALSGVKYESGYQDMNVGNQSVFDNRNGVLYNFYTDQQFVTAFNENTRRWTKPYLTAPITNFIQVNKFISYKDSSLYVLGGYGHHVYRNSIHRYHFNTGEWEENIKTDGDFFMPRYLAALGANSSGDTAYILGGYGNTNGQQMLNPRSLYDMMRFDVTRHTFRKLFELDLKEKDLAFANSLAINEEEGTYYGLLFPPLKYESSLRLIKGSLRDNHYALLGDSIPYSFNDLRSFADLYYGAASRKFVAVTLLRSEDSNTTVARIFTLSSPPDTAPAALEAAGKSRWRYWAGAGLLLAVLLFVMLRYRPRNKAVSHPQAAMVKEGTHAPEIAAAAPHLPGAAIFLFGELQLTTEAGEEIVNSFTPLTKELFLFLFIHSIKLKRGVSSEKLTETLWFDKDEKSARNNRSVNIAKLKTVLDQLKHYEISRKTGYWKIEMDYEAIHVDYQHYLSIVSDKGRLDKEKIQKLSAITGRGNFLANCDYSWLDQLKSEISNEIIDTYLKFASGIGVEEDPDFLIEISNYIFNIDSVNEEAMQMKCRALVFLGKHSLAKSTFESFRREYKNIYAEEFGKDFHAVLNAEE